LQRRILARTGAGLPKPGNELIELVGSNSGSNFTHQLMVIMQVMNGIKARAEYLADAM
jgi:hypothetical protein